MTDKQINAAIAEACGFVCLHEFQVDKDGAKFAFWDYPPTWTGPKKQPWLLDFCNDLNAMHEAEKTLAPKNWNNYSENWWIYCNLLRVNDADEAIHATARQRAEAFLRALGKWEPTTEESSADQKEVQP